MAPQTTSEALPDWLGRAAANAPERLALRYNGTDWTFAELDRQATALARRLATLGIGAGSPVALLAANSLHIAALVHALTRLGAVLVPLNTRHSRPELRWQLEDVGARLLICDERHAETATALSADLPQLACFTLSARSLHGEAPLSSLVEAPVLLRTEIDLNAHQAILYTSGTTGHPKGAIITYRMQWWSAIGSALNLGLHDDCWLACLPFFHIGGLSTLFKNIIYQMPVVIFDHFDAAAVNDAIARDRVTIISVVAVMLQRMLAALDVPGGDGHYPEHFRCALLGGGPAPRALLEDCARRGIPVVQTYGMTESCSQAATLAPADALRKLGSAGKPLLPVRLRIMRDGREAAPSEAGEIELCGPTITPGYVGRAAASSTTAAFHHGWLKTGDIGYLDDDGYLYVLDRRSDLIISGGENIYPAEIEAVLLAHPAVAEAGVCGMPDPEWGHVPVAFVRLRDEVTATPDDLLAHARAHLARYKVPRQVYFSGPLPRNAAGKLLRRKLLTLLPDHDAAANAPHE